MDKKRVLSCKTRDFLIKDEREAVQRYNKLGYSKLAIDEGKHLDFLKKQPCRK